MIYTSVAYRINNKIFIGVSEKSSAGYYTISEFVTALNLKLDNYSDKFLYIVMVSETEQSRDIYLMDKASIVNTEGIHSDTSSMGGDDLLDMSNRLLKRFKDNVQFH